MRSQPTINMFHSVLALVAVLPCLVTVNGAIVQRGGTTTPSTYNAQTSSSPTSSYPTTSETSVTIPVSEKTSSTYSSSPTSTYPPTSSSTVVIPPTKSAPTTTPIYTCPHTVYECATSSGTPTGTGSGAPSPSGGANCNGVQEWQSAFAYTTGNEAIYDNELYTALQWTYNNAPPAHPDQWSCGGVCAQPVNNQVECQGVSAWQSSTAYNGGSKVTYNNHLWSAVQWVQSNAPGDESGSWKDLGLCGW